MARKAKNATAEVSKPAPVVERLSQVLSKKPLFQTVKFWVAGDTPLITHAWSEKAKREILSKQVKATRGGKEPRDPHADFISSLYEMSEGVYGFPVTGLKNAILSVAHKDKGIARSAVMSALWLDAEMVRVRPALAGAICDMPLVRIYGSKPENREDMVKIGGMQKVASLAYRAQFTRWAFKITAKINASIITADALAFLIQEAGMACGLGEWRNERRGIFGSFHLCDEAEETAWEKFAAGKGPIPSASPELMAAE